VPRPTKVRGAIALIALSLFSVNIAPLSHAQAAKTLAITESNNGRTVKASLGQSISITLHSTYWNVGAVSHLKLVGDAQITPIMPGPSAPATCQHPGMGCGTIVWKYVATARGTSSFTATRDSCGEALQCTATQKKFKVTFKVA
jgi:hypothetical protein